MLTPGLGCSLRSHLAAMPWAGFLVTQEAAFHQHPGVLGPEERIVCPCMRAHSAGDAGDHGINRVEPAT